MGTWLAVQESTGCRAFGHLKMKHLAKENEGHCKHSHRVPVPATPPRKDILGTGRDGTVNTTAAKMTVVTADFVMSS